MRWVPGGVNSNDSDLPDDQSIVFSGSRLRPVICPGKRPFRPPM